MSKWTLYVLGAIFTAHAVAVWVLVSWPPEAYYIDPGPDPRPLGSLIFLVIGIGCFYYGYHKHGE